MQDRKERSSAATSRVTVGRKAGAVLWVLAAMIVICQAETARGETPNSAPDKKTKQADKSSTASGLAPASDGQKATTQPSAGAKSATDGGAAEATSAEELMLFEDMPIVVSAARKAQRSDWLSMPVSVFDAKDIHYSGLQEIPEMLQFVPGVDVLRLDRNRYAVGVRGLHDLFSDRTLVLIDGRPANNAGFGGVEWFRLPILPEDIKQIEVVRGPGGAAWGTNALTGVVNIITKDPADSLGRFASTQVNHFGDTSSHLRWAEKAGGWSWRQSVGYRRHRSSDDALDDDTFRSRDFSRNWVFDGKAIYRFSDQTRVSSGIAYSHVDAGDYEMFGYFPRKNYRLQTARLFSRLEHKDPNGTSGHLQWYGHYSSSKAPNLVDRYCLVENDLEGQVEIAAGEHGLTFGGNIRQFRASTRRDDVQEVTVGSGDLLDEQWAGLFAMDRWQITDRLVFENQIRGDWYSVTKLDWSGRTSALYALDSAKKHIARVSAAKAFRAPTAGIRKARLMHVPVAPGLFAFNLVEPLDDLKNEESWAVEAGYHAKLAKWLTFRADSYYQRYRRLIGMKMLPDPIGFGRTFATLDNLQGADSYGAETEVVVSGKRGRLSAWYAYNDLDRDEGHQNVRAFLPARHKVGVRGRLNLPRHCTLNSDYRYTTATADDGGKAFRAHATHRLDLSVAKKLWKERLELSVGVSDIFNKDLHPLFGAGNMTAHETPGRTFFVRLQLSF